MDHELRRGAVTAQGRGEVVLGLGFMLMGENSSVIMVESCARHAARRRDQPWLETTRDAAIEVRRPTLFGELIILIVFLPILTLEGIDGRLFKPMALTMIFALSGSLVVSLTLMPVLASLFLEQGRRHVDPWLVRQARRVYTPFLDLALRFRRATLITALVLVAGGGVLASRLGGEFLPRLGVRCSTSNRA